MSLGNVRQQILEFANLGAIVWIVVGTHFKPARWEYAGHLVDGVHPVALFGRLQFERGGFGDSAGDGDGYL